MHLNAYHRTLFQLRSDLRFANYFYALLRQSVVRISDARVTHKMKYPDKELQECLKAFSSYSEDELIIKMQKTNPECASHIAAAMKK